MTDPKPSAEERARDLAPLVAITDDPQTLRGIEYQIELALSAAVSEAVESTVREAAKELCQRCAAGEALSYDGPETEDGEMWWHALKPGSSIACNAFRLWLRWPALAPKEEK